MQTLSVRLGALVQQATQNCLATLRDAPVAPAAGDGAR
jgi:hypothetical protein